jgi:cell division protein FtsI (penicillin-binding protein 3)
MTEKRAANRFVVLAVLLGLAMAGLAARLVILHLGVGASTGIKSDDARTYRETLAVPRGRILDGSASANLLALNVGVKDIWADPAPLAASNRVGATAALLAGPLKLDRAELAARLNKPTRHFEYVARYVPEDTAETIARLKLPGIYLNTVTTRSYPQGNLLCHVMGFVNHDGVGSAGIEQCMDRHLKGTPGLLESKLDGRRREIPNRRIREVRPRDGADITLTIDQNLQYMVEKALDAAMERHRTKAMMAVMQRIETGEILAMASRPAFDPNQFTSATDEQKRNRCIGCVYEPGSTFKVAVIAAALDVGIVQPETIFDTENGRWMYQSKILRDYHPYTQLNVADIIKKSSNIGAAKIAIMLGDERLDRYLRAFNIGSRLGIDLPGEEAGILYPVTKWTSISSSRIAIGQGVAVTALQMLGVMCGIANGGVMMQPYVVKEVTGADGAVLLRREPRALGRCIRADTAAVMRQLLARVTEEGGTGVKAAVAGFKVAGKTGTAQKPIAGQYSESDYMASFVGFLPAERPEIGLIVVADEPQPIHTGGVVAAPVFGEVVEQAVRYLGISPAGAAAPAATVAFQTGGTR